jgi:hypothetical protein
MIYRNEEEIVNLAADIGSTAKYNYKSDMRTAKFGTNRRSEYIAAIDTLATTPSGKNYYHDVQENFLRDQSVNNSQYIEEERGIFHDTATYP